MTAVPTKEAPVDTSATPTTFVTATKPATTAAPAAPSASSGSNSGSDSCNSGSASGSVKIYGQCGGQNYSGPTSCEAGLICKEWNPYYHQCVSA